MGAPRDPGIPQTGRNRVNYGDLPPSPSASLSPRALLPPGDVPPVPQALASRLSAPAGTAGPAGSTGPAGAAGRMDRREAAGMRLVASASAALVAPGKGILDTAESVATASARLTAAGIVATPEHRRAYRELLITTPGLAEGI